MLELMVAMGMKLMLPWSKQHRSMPMASQCSMATMSSMPTAVHGISSSMNMPSISPMPMWHLSELC